MTQLMRPIALLLALSVVPVTALASEPSLDRADYLSARDSLIALDRSLRRSATLELDSLERAADRVLARLKAPWDTLATWQYPPARRFHEVRAAYDTSGLLPVMDRLPKGAMLHAHPSATGSFGVLLDATFDPRAWIYTGPDTTTWLKHGTLGFGDEAPGEGWERIVELRAVAEDTAEFNRSLRESITLGLEDYGRGDIWDHFEGNFSRMWRLSSHPAIWHDHMLHGCLELAAQGVQHVEYHTYLGPQQRHDGSMGTAAETVEAWLAIRDEVRDAGYPDFSLKLIGAISRWGSVERVEAYLRTVADLRAAYPDVIVGYDLVSEEDRTGTNLHFLDALLSAHHHADSLGVTLRPCIHSGESNRLDNENLFDAVLLHAKRIGHGYGLWRHPVLLDTVLARDIAIEICPISNQALGYVVDLRNHPAVEYLARGVPIVLSPDDPGMMRYRWAYDWVAVTSAWDLGIADLKRMILDSFLYSGMNDAERAAALAVWEEDWRTWIAELAALP